MHRIPDRGSRIAFTPQYLTVDGDPWFPVMGEMHYSRVLESAWETELNKMKAGGVDIVSVYTIWIHHEEEEGIFDLAGNKDLRSFLLLIRKCGLGCFLRIGPWIHGEVRNGGFPDWLMAKEREGILTTRTNDPVYLEYVRRFYERIYEQAKGLFLQDGGPVLGIQIENEYGHCGGLGGEAGEEHMRTLQRMAQEIGFDVPLWTATGWGGAVTGGMLPVMGGYCEAPWDPSVGELAPSGNYVFTEERNDHGIGSDHGIGEGLTFDMAKFPYLTAELGGGLQVTGHRRPVASAADIAAMSMVKLGSGCNLLGYYMYHGGTNPYGRLSTLQESRATGYPNDLPELSYDFNAPIREYGQLTDTFRRIRMLSMFAHDYEDILCRTVYVPQPGNPSKPEDLSSMRTAFRYDRTTGAGFFFVNNYQRRYPMAEHPDTELTAHAAASAETGSGKSISFGRHDIHDGDHFFWPAGIRYPSGAVLEKACAVPLCILHTGTECGDVSVFYTADGREPGYRMAEGSCTDIRAGASAWKGDTLFLTLCEQEALHAMKVSAGEGAAYREYLVISDDDLIPDGHGGYSMILRVEERKTPSFRIWPEPETPPAGFVRAEEQDDPLFTLYTAAQLVNDAEAAVRKCAPGEQTAGKEDGSAVWALEAAASSRAVQTLLLVDYDGNSACMFKSSGRKCADNFYTGQTWETDLARLEEAPDDSGEREAGGAYHGQIRIEPLTPASQVFLENTPDMTGGSACRIRNVRTAAVFAVPVMLA